jgi:hypothetical protein
MTVKLNDLDARGVLDYQEIEPTMDHMLKQHRKLRVFVERHEYQGETGAAMWEEFKLSAENFNDIERLAMARVWLASMVTL